MKLLDTLHRWAGGTIGLILVVIGLSGALLIHKDAWVGLSFPAAAEAQRQDLDTIAGAVERLMADPGARPRSILFATRDFGLHRLSYAGEAGGYATQDGEIVARWESKWERPELWLFDLHHYLLAGDAGETVAGIAGLVGLFFTVSGAILWWRTRRTFAFRLWPRRMTRSAITRHHRDLGVVAAPLLILSMTTGVMMTLRPVADALLSPLSPPGTVTASLAPPAHPPGPLAADPGWRAMLAAARARYPEAELRVLSLPGPEGGLISLRTRRPAEWLPQGRTTFWFDAGTGDLVDARDALALPPGARAFNQVYPLHAAKVGGLPYRLVMTLSGLALALLGGFAMWSFWGLRGRGRGRRAPPTRYSEVLP